MNISQWGLLIFYYLLLYFFTIVYNVSNKQLVQVIHLPCTIAVIQTFIGFPIIFLLWLWKPLKISTKIDYKNFSIVALFHSLGNWATVYALQTGSVGFVHVVKSAEPIFASFLAYYIMNSSFSYRVYLTIIPIVLGIAIASAKEASFTWEGFSSSMLSNLFYQSRIVLSKYYFVKDDSKISAADSFRLITLISFIELLPLSFIFEGYLWKKELTYLTQHPDLLYPLLNNLIISGISFYLYNEIAFWILEFVHPITHAIGNTLKRVVLIISAMFIFHTQLSFMGGLGIGIAMIGSFLYGWNQTMEKK